jgi:hypothetical protein
VFTLYLVINRKKYSINTYLILLLNSIMPEKFLSSATKARLADAQSNYDGKRVVSNGVNHKIKDLRSQMAKQQAELNTPAGQANKIARENGQRQLKYLEGEINKLLPIFQKANKETETARAALEKVKAAAHEESRKNSHAARTQPQTDNRKVAPAPTKQATTVKETAPLQQASTPGTKGQAPEKDAAPNRAKVEPTRPTSQGGKKETPAQDKPSDSEAEEKVSGTDITAPKQLPPEEVPEPRNDHRIRLSAFDRLGGDDAKKRLYGEKNKETNILAPLWDTDGLMFPYTPTIQVSQDTTWQTADLEHSNFDILSFQKSSSAQISLTGKFTVQNEREGRYLLAVIHFLRTVSKAYFGAQHIENFDPPVRPEGTDSTTEEDTNAVIDRAGRDGKAGLPPPVLLFSGYGTMMFNDLRVVVKSHSWTYEETADLIRIDLGDKRTVWLPPMMTINITLAIQNNTDRNRDRFNLDEFRTGALLMKRGWF